MKTVENSFLMVYASKVIKVHLEFQNNIFRSFFFHTFFIGFEPIKKINIFVVTWD